MNSWANSLHSVANLPSRSWSHPADVWLCTRSVYFSGRFGIGSDDEVSVRQSDLNTINFRFGSVGKWLKNSFNSWNNVSCWLCLDMQRSMWCWSSIWHLHDGHSLGYWNEYLETRSPTGRQLCTNLLMKYFNWYLFLTTIPCECQSKDWNWWLFHLFLSLMYLIIALFWIICLKVFLYL